MQVNSLVLMASLAYLPLCVMAGIGVQRAFLDVRSRLGAFMLHGVFLATYGLPGLLSFAERGDISSPLGSVAIVDPLVIVSAAGLVYLSYFVSVYAHRALAGRQHKVEFQDLRTHKNFRPLVSACIVSAAVSLLSLIIYSREYGGFVSALTSAATIRSGYGELHSETSSGLTFVKYFLPTGMFALLCAAYLNAVKSTTPRTIALVASAVLLLACLVLMGSRTRLLLYFIGVALFYKGIATRRFDVSRWLFGFAIMILSIMILVYGKAWYSGISTGREMSANGISLFSVVDSFIGYFTHRVYSVEIAIVHFWNTSELEWFSDVLMIPFYFIPERLTGIVKPESISYLNTFQLVGVWDSMVPPGVVGYGAYALTVPGVVLVSIVFGAVFGVSDRLVRKGGLMYYICTLPAVFCWALYASTGDMRVLVNGSVHIVFFYMLMYSMIVLKRLRFSRG